MNNFVNLNLVLHNCTETCLTEGDIRLLGGSRVGEGRVEVCRAGVWGTVRHSNWNTPDAIVVCRQLGLSVKGNVIALN